MVKAVLAKECINVTHSTVSGTRLDMEARGLSAVVRASVHYFNTEDEVRRVVAVLRTALPRLLAKASHRPRL